MHTPAWPLTAAGGRALRLLAGPDDRVQAALATLNLAE